MNVIRKVATIIFDTIFTIVTIVLAVIIILLFVDYSRTAKPVESEYIEIEKAIVKETSDICVETLQCKTYEKPIIEYDIEIIEVEEKVEEELVVNQEDVELLAIAIYVEMGGDECCDECRYRVGDVILNRKESNAFPNTIHEVLTEKSQYGMFHWTGVVWPEKASNPNEAHAVKRAYKIAEDILRGNHSELYGNGYIWQAEFEQGKEGFWHCDTYFGR